MDEGEFKTTPKTVRTDGAAAPRSVFEDRDHYEEPTRADPHMVAVALGTGSREPSGAFDDEQPTRMANADAVLLAKGEAALARPMGLGHIAQLLSESSNQTYTEEEVAGLTGGEHTMILSDAQVQGWVEQASASEHTNILSGEQFQQWIAANQVGDRSVGAQEPPMPGMPVHQSPDVMQGYVPQNVGAQAHGVAHPQIDVRPRFAQPDAGHGMADPLGPQVHNHTPPPPQHYPVTPAPDTTSSRDEELFALPPGVSLRPPERETKSSKVGSTILLGLITLAAGVVIAAFLLPNERAKLQEQFFPTATGPRVISSEVAPPTPAPKNSRRFAKNNEQLLLKATTALAEGRREEALKIYKALSEEAPANELYRHTVHILNVSEAAK